MSYPNIIYGDFGDEKVTASAKIGGLPLGVRMQLPDGRIYAHAKANTAAALVAGYINVARARAATAGNQLNLLVAANAAIGATSIVLTMPATTVCGTADQYADGYVFVDDATGEGITYKVKASNAAVASATATFTLYPTDKIKVALVSGTSECGVKENEFYLVLARAAGTGEVGMVAGVANVAVSAGYFCWLQRRGPCAVLVGATVGVVGRLTACSSAVSGVQDANLAANTSLNPVSVPIGWCMVAGVDTENELDYLILD